MTYRGYPVLVTDTETTGFIQYTESQKRSMRPLEQQPHVTQLAAVLFDADGDEIASISALIRPTNWTIPEEAAAVTGLTTERIAQFGIPIRAAMASWAHMAKLAKLIVAHNAAFDLAILQVEATRLGWGEIPTLSFCTMLAGTPLCQLPHPKPRHEHDYKWPTLQQLHEFLFHEKFEGAHDAMNDARAAARCYFRLVEMGLTGDKRLKQLRQEQAAE